ncbi:endonuclease [Streptomyces sp. MUM 178J]|uniref:endonuclease n=1 Tax=Streptomyces sp. MUM 178J TaxID=2791991 RepID=UPI001F04A749|nr:endonuclease [Streptomyces sp. MUM 178J]WRQ78205.1 endonuclease [Streptomyces sp. MUM 178J]
MARRTSRTNRANGSGSAPDSATVRALLDRHGRTYAEDAGIRLKDAPQPLYQLLVLAGLLSARIRATTAVAAARALFAAGMRTPRAMAEASRQQRVDALGEGGYRHYDERTAAQLGEGAELLLESYGGDLRRLRAQADGDPVALRGLLRRTPGIGPAGVSIFLREAQGVWSDLAPYLDGKALDGAERLGLPRDPEALAGLVPERELPALAAALVRAALDREVAEEVRRAAQAA